MINTDYYQFGVETWVLIGILAYILIILFVLYLRYCIISKSLCPFSKCQLHKTKETCFECVVCAKWKRNRSESCFCCRKPHLINEPCCKTNLPALKCTYFLPKCSYCYLCCCEMSLEYDFKRKSPQNEIV